YVEDVDLNLNGFNGNIKGNYSVFSEKGFDIFYTDGIDTTKICNFKAKPFSCYFDTEMNLVASIDTQGVVKHYYVRNNKGNFEKPELVGSNESLEN
ncbi:MAG: hypothetical protein U9Q99_02810, partial [Nanoarchaeota archaeon]|nr:hypothetical protein [Nanoarchaeota archaeon]